MYYTEIENRAGRKQNVLAGVHQRLAQQIWWSQLHRKQLNEQSRDDGVPSLLGQPLRLVVLEVGIGMKERSGRRPDLVRARMNLDLKSHLALKRAARFLVLEPGWRAELAAADVLQRRWEEQLRRVAVVLLRLRLRQLLLEAQLACEWNKWKKQLLTTGRGCGSSASKASWIKVPQKRCNCTDVSSIPGRGIGVRKNPSCGVHEANIAVNARFGKQMKKLLLVLGQRLKHSATWQRGRVFESSCQVLGFFLLFSILSVVCP